MADPAYFALRQMILDEITPVVMVLPTPLVEQRCQKNGLSFVQMLTPFCVFNNIDVPVRTANDQPYRLQKFKLRMFYGSDVRQPNVEVTKERLKQVITDAGNSDDSDLYLDPSPIETKSISSEPEFVPKWFHYFNKELVRSVSFSDHETFDHPVACLLVVSSNDDDPINKFVDLFNTNQLPPLFNDGAMDPKITKHFILVHDNQDGSSERATKILAEMRNTFGLSECRLLCINSSQDGLVDHEPNPWDHYIPNASPGQPLGRLLNKDDMDELRDFVRDLSSKNVIPNMEQKIRVLNQQVSATRKGFRNQIKNLWWRKGKEDTPETQNVGMYTFSSIESQIRLLGDYAFMLRDYELALSNYRLLSTDYKLDKAWKRYAGVQEMMGLTNFMLSQSKKDAEYCMENAFTTYLRIGTLGKGNATRCGLWWVEMLKTSSQFKEAAGVYFRISGEEPLHSAVMLEQASYCYLLSKPPMLRKYGFHLILSGDLYKKCDQIKHAIRAYRNALSVFKGTTWSHIRDHVHFQIGKWYASLGRFDVAMKHMLEIVACSHQSKPMQELFMKDFFQILKGTGKTYNISRLQLPVVNISSLIIVSEDHRTYGSLAAASVKESVWQSLEEEMVPSLSNAKATWLDLQSKLLPTKLKQSNICVAGEALKVEIAFKNPLQLSISISNVTLMCEYSADEALPDQNSSSSVNHGVEDEKIATGRDLSSDTSLFTLSEDNMTLPGGETTVAQLSVIPRKEGRLRVTGVSWKLSDSMVGFYTFEPDLIKKRISKQKRKANQNNKLEFLVIKSLPRLEGLINNLPSTVYAGNLQRLSLELRNSSEIPVKNLKMKISHPRFLNIGNPKISDVNFPACLEKEKSSTHTDADLDTTKQSETVFHFPEDTVIHKETPFFLPLWFRAAIPGNVSLYITIYYEIEDKSTAMRYRTFRTHHMLEVLPSLDVSFHISPCPSRLQEYVLRMDVINRTSLRNFKLRQLSSIGNGWQISLIESIKDIFPSGNLVAGQALSCFLKLKTTMNNQQALSITTDDMSTVDPTTQRKHAAMMQRLSNLQQSRVSNKTDPKDPSFESTESFLLRFTNSKQSIESSLTQIQEISDKDPNQNLKPQLERISLSITDLEKLVAENSYFLPPYEVRSSLKTISDLKQTLDTVTSKLKPRKKFSFKNKPVKNPETADIVSKDANKNEEPKSSYKVKDSPGFRSIENEVLVKDFKGSEIREYILSDLTNCEVRLTGCFQTLFINRLQNCKVYVGPVFGSILIEEVEGCLFVLASHQIRIHHAKSSDFYLRCRSRPIIEQSFAVRFAPYCLCYNGIESDLKESNLNDESENWANVDDFQWLRAVQSPNWSVLPERERIDTVKI